MIQFNLETPPVSPPVLDLVPLPGLTPVDGQIYLQDLPKKPVLKINPNNFKIVQNVKGMSFVFEMHGFSNNLISSVVSPY